MKILLHDGYNISDPLAFTAILSALKGVNDFVSKNFGSWRGLNQKFLALIGRDPATDPAKIEQLKNDFLQPGGRYNATDTGRLMRALYNGTISDPDLVKLAEILKKNVKQAADGAAAGDWVAARYVIVYTEFLNSVKQTLQTRAASTRESPGATRPPVSPGATAPVLPNLALPIAALVAFKLLF